MIHLDNHMTRKKKINDWQEITVQDFLGLTDEEMDIIEQRINKIRNETKKTERSSRSKGQEHDETCDAKVLGKMGRAADQQAA